MAEREAVHRMRWNRGQAVSDSVKLSRAEKYGELQAVARELAKLRIQRDRLIREHPGTYREIAQAAGLSFQQVGNIKARKEEK